MCRHVIAWSGRAASSLLAVALISSTARAALVDPIPEKIPDSGLSVNLKNVNVGGVTSPVYLTGAPDNSGRLFVVDQTGVVKVVNNGAASTFLDVRSQINKLDPSYDERGLLGLAFDPNFSSNGKVYTYYTTNPGAGTPDYTDPFLNGAAADHQGVVSQLTLDPKNPNKIDTTSRKELLRWDHPNPNHNGGTLAFGPDGNLYISIGEGGGADDQEGQLLDTTMPNGPRTKGKAPEGNAQRTDMILGKILRIDVNGSNSKNGKYGIPADNPFANQSGKAPEIFAYGLRNPYRVSFDKASGQLLADDVGQQSVEEVDSIVNGGNYGWRLKEGSFTFDPLDTNTEGVVTKNSPGSPSGLIDPILQYDHDEGEASIGGFVYRGSKIPELVGKYIFGDLGKDLDQNKPSGELFIGDLSNGKISRLATNLGNPFRDYFLKGFGEDANGELYVLASPNIGPAGSGNVFEITASSTGGGGGGNAIPLPAPFLLGAFGMSLAAGARRWVRV